MKKVDLNRQVHDVAGNQVTVATLQRRIAPGVQPNQAQELTPATYAMIAFSAIENQRGKQISDEQVKISYSTLKKINDGIAGKTTSIDLEDAEYLLVEAAFESQVVSIRAPYIEMVEELNPAVV